MTSTKILIEGVGSIGGVVSAELIKAGYNVTLITGNELITKEINSNGLRLIEDGQEVEYTATTHTSLADITPSLKYDIAFLIMKADGVKAAAKETIPYLSPDGFLATFQNGLVEYALRDQIDPNKIVPVTIGFGGTMHSPGRYEKTSPGSIHIGELDGSSSLRISQLGEILAHVEEVEISNNMEGVLWSKLAINCTINTFGAISGLTLGQMLKDGEVRDLFLETYREVVDVAHAQGITLEPIAANPYRLYREQHAGWFTRLVKDIILRIVGWKYRDVRSSSLQSIERGRKSEIDILNGFVVEQGEQSGVDTRVNAALTAVMYRIDEGELDPDPKNLELVLVELDQS